MFDPRVALPVAADTDIGALRDYLLHVAERRLARRRLDANPSDFVQAALLQAHAAGGCRASCPEQRRGWLRAILVNLIRRASRRPREAPLCPALADGAEAPPIGPTLQEERARRLAAAVARLPDEQRQVIQLRFEKQLAFGEIGLALGKSPDAARMLFNRALEALRGLLAEAAS